MVSTSSIEWTDMTWNPVTGCSKVSQGCKHCYAERQWPRMRAMVEAYKGRAFTDVKCHPERLHQPLRIATPKKIFVNSMSDLFHEDVPFEFIASVFAVMSVTTRHTYQVLTKRPSRMREFFEWAMNGHGPDHFNASDRISDHWPKHVEWKGYDNCGPAFPYQNIWLGISIENQETANDRIPYLLQTPAAVRWISAEPLIGPIDFYKASNHWHKNGYTPWRNTSVLSGIDWIVIGGESGPQARPIHPQWAHQILDQSIPANVARFFKQWGEYEPIAHYFSNTEKRDEALLNPRHILVTSNGNQWNTDKDGQPPSDCWIMLKTGKHNAGNALVGRKWQEFPAIEHVRI